jgi:uncharacterized protein (TIGR02600 family)
MSHTSNPRRKGFALILVLICLAMAVTMAALFLASAADERRGVDTYARGSQVRHLSGMAVASVIGRINQATKEGTAADPVSWASQPGMVRTFAANGDPANVYKLYSWDNPVEAGTGFNPTAPQQAPPSDWRTNAALFTDLNQPINDVYPIVDPAAEGVVAGFEIDPSADPVAGSGLPAPMPVKWLYVLADGQMAAPSGGSGNTATVPGATADNPIVGRVAFWTDDETAKVNINTASEGSFWDWPKAATYNEMQFAGNPPVSGEFNRVPGHPAMTSLSAVFPELDPGDRWGGLANYRSKLQDLLGRTPRVPYSNASSRGGTYPIETENYNYGPTGTLPAIPGTPLTLKTDRLYATADEFFFSFNATNRTLPASPLITADMMQKRLFFLTANSRAPETTLFETPRVSLWPVTWPWPSAHAQLPNRQTAAVSSPVPVPDAVSMSNNPWMRAEERLLAFTSTLKSTNGPSDGRRYYFQRQNNESGTHDYQAITNNQVLLSYLQRLTSEDVPGYGGSLAGKYTPATRNQMLANIFNSIRSLVNQYTFSNDGKLLYSYTPVSFARFLKTNSATPEKNYKETGAFSAVPLKVNLGTGERSTISEFPSLREVALVFYATDRVLPSKKTGAGLNYNDPLNWDNLINVSGVAGYPAGARTTRMRAVMLLDFFSLGGIRGNQPVFWVKISADSLSAEETKLGFNQVVAKLDYQTPRTRGYLIPSHLLPLFTKTTNAITGTKTFNLGDVTNANYGLVSAEITLDPNALEFNFSGGPISIQVYSAKNGDPDMDTTSDADSLVASYSVDFSSWDGSHKIPLAPRWNYFDRMNEKKTDPSDANTSECPNPGFNVTSKWAAIEIAPRYVDAKAEWDPATGGVGSIPKFSDLYQPDGNGSITYLPGTSGNGIYRAPPTYIYRSSSGTLMTDYQKRIDYFYKFLAKASYAGAEYSGYELKPSGNVAAMFNPGGFPAITVYDSVFSVTPNPVGVGQGDPRLAKNFSFQAVNAAMGPSAKMRQVLTSEYGNPTKQYHTLGASSGFPSVTGYITSLSYSLLGNTISPNGMAVFGGPNTRYGDLGRGGNDGNQTVESDNSVGVVSMRTTNSLGGTASVGDWTSGAGYLPDGGQLASPDQDFQSLIVQDSPGNYTYTTPYFTSYNETQDRGGLNTPSSKGYFSPNRQIPSPITLLGSIPSSTTVGWQSLLFSPNPAAGATHPGLAGLPDYVFLDLFWMPVAEPYPISELFSTAGKINLNYKIMPFSYINRSTGIHALLKSTWLTALDNSLARNYKSHFFVRGMPDSQTRYPINADETLERMDITVFDSGDIFRSAAEICSIWLVPEEESALNVQNFWNGKLLTSDTAREQPYDHLYSRITTKSNTFTVHWRAQSLQKAPTGDAGTWNEATDRVAAELRGATLIERFIDPNATNIPDYATDPDAETLANFYKWRTITESFFQPK